MAFLRRRSTLFVAAIVAASGSTGAVLSTSGSMGVSGTASLSTSVQVVAPGTGFESGSASLPTLGTAGCAASGTATAKLIVSSLNTWVDVTPTDFSLNVNTGGALQNFGCQDVFVDPANPSILWLFSDYQGVWKSTDYGLTWKQIVVGSLSVVNQGRQWGHAINPSQQRDPLTNSRLLTFSGFGTLGCLISDDGGVTWSRVTVAGGSVNENDIYMFDVDPANPLHVIAGNHQLNRIYESFNGGNTWADKGPVVDASNNNSNHSIYIFFVGKDANTWLALSDASVSTVSTTVTGTNASTTNLLVASSANFIVGFSVLVTADGTIHTVTALPDATHVTVTPAMTAAPTTGTVQQVTGGVYRTTNAGTSWTLVLGSGGHDHGVEQILVLGSSGVIYMPTGAQQGAASGIWKSTDYGATWAQITTTGSSEVAIFGDYLVSLSGFPNQGGNPPRGQRALRSSDTVWNTTSTWTTSIPTAMNNGGKTLTVTDDGQFLIAIAGCHNAGLWRYIEKSHQLRSTTNINHSLAAIATLSSAGANLIAAGTGTVTSTSSITTGIPLVAAGTETGSGLAVLPINISAVATGTESGLAGLSTAIPLSSVGLGQLTSTSSLVSSIVLAATSLGTESGLSSLGTAITLAASSSGFELNTAALSTGPVGAVLSANGTLTESGASSLSTSTQLNAIGSLLLSVNSSLSTSVLLSSTNTSALAVTANLISLSPSLLAPGTGTTLGAAALISSITLISSASSSMTGSAVLAGISAALVASSTALETIGSSLSTSIALVGANSSGLTGSGTIITSTLLSSAGFMALNSSGLLATGVSLIASSNGLEVGTAAINGVASQLAAINASSLNGSGLLFTGVNLTASSNGLETVVAAISSAPAPLAASNLSSLSGSGLLVTGVPLSASALLNEAVSATISTQAAIIGYAPGPTSVVSLPVNPRIQNVIPRRPHFKVTR